MLIAIVGENCTGKSTLANALAARISGKIFSGRDYLRLEKNPFRATETFKTMLQASAAGEENIIYLITEQEHLALLPEGAFRIVLTEQLDVIKARFRERMRGALPKPLEKMLEEKHGMYDTLPCDLKLEPGYSIEEVLGKL